MIFEQENQENFPEKKQSFGEKILREKFENDFWKKYFEIFFSTSSAYPVHISNRSDYCITLSYCPRFYNHKKEQVYEDRQCISHQTMHQMYKTFNYLRKIISI